MQKSTLRGAACAALVVALLVPTKSNAETIVYTGGSLDDDLWSTAANWDLGVPGSDDDVIVVDVNKPLQVSQPSAVASEINVFGGGVLNVTGGDLTFGFENKWLWVGFQTAGTVNQSGGTIVGTGVNNRLTIDSFGTYNMTGGTLDTEDLWLEDGAVLEVGGQSTLIVRDDLRVKKDNTVTLRVNLVGDTAPQIIIEDDFRVQGDVHLDINTSLWTGAEDIQLFQVDDRVQNGFAFASVTIGGVPMDVEDFQFLNGSVSIPVSEPSGQVLGGLAIFCLLLGSTPAFARRIRGPAVRTRTSSPHLAGRKADIPSTTVPPPAHQIARGNRTARLLRKPQTAADKSQTRSNSQSVSVKKR